MLDVRLLQALRSRIAFNRLRAFIPKQALEPATKILLDDFHAYYDKFTEHGEIDYETFMSWFETFRHPDQKPEGRALMRNLMRRALAEEAPQGTTDVLLRELHELRLAHIAQAAVLKWNEGELNTPIGDVLKAALEEYKIALGVSEDVWVRPDMDALLAEEFNMQGIMWPMPEINTCIRPLRAGDFGIVAARPDRGKTTFMSYLVTSFAKQLPSNRPIIWLNNEGPGRRIYLRLYRSALRTNLAGMMKLNESAKLHEAYNAALGGLDRIRVLDIHNMNTAQVDSLLELHDPGVIVYDMLDNIRWAGVQAPRQDLIAEDLYQWARERSVKYDCIGFCTSQINGAGDGMLYPQMGMLKDSATTKQGACDFIIMLGASNDPGLDGVRGFSMPKNKLRKDGAPNPRFEIMIDYETSSYRALTEVQEPEPEPAPATAAADTGMADLAGM